MTPWLDSSEVVGEWGSPSLPPIGDYVVAVMARLNAKRPKRRSHKALDEVCTHEKIQADLEGDMPLLDESPQGDAYARYYYSRADSQSSGGSSGRSSEASPLSEQSVDIFAYLTPDWETSCFDNECNAAAFEDTATALKLHKDSTRRAQNRSAQRAYRERQQSRLKEMQITIEDLTSDRDGLRSRIKDLESDLHRTKMDATIQSIKLQRQSALLENQQRPKRRPALSRTSSTDGVGWMLKQIYGLDEAEDEMFTVFEVRSG